jgi:phosphoribosylamine--glycine ligase
MNLLVIGSGGREHALVWKLAQSVHVDRIWCAPGNAGIGEERCTRTGTLVECVPLSAEDLPALLTFAQERRPGLTVVGPDNPLAMGVVDLFQKVGLRIWGPNQRAAQIESSKTFSQTFMEKYGVPTAVASAFTEVTEAKAFASALNGRCAVKADGLALGKGVTICSTEKDANEVIGSMLLDKAFGSASERIVIQELLEGPEISLHAFCDGRTVRLFPTSQDHKRALDGDHGPNTGGMGAYCPTPYLTNPELKEAERLVIDPWLAGCAAEGIDFRGLLYPGVILTEGGPKVFEFNARFGDPETQVYLPVLQNDLLEVFEACVDGCLDQVLLTWAPVYAVCVVMASAGYPGPYQKGHPIKGLPTANALQNTKVFHASTVEVNGEVVTNGGRVLGVTAWRETLREAQLAAYSAVDCIAFEGAFSRRDIAAKAL